LIRFERSLDYEKIRGVVTHPRLYPHLSDDNSPAAEDYYPPAGMRMYGVNEASYLKNGMLCDQICLGITAPHEMPVPEVESYQEIHDALARYLESEEGNMTNATLEGVK
jgi:hypothetical protein